MRKLIRAAIVVVGVIVVVVVAVVIYAVLNLNGIIQKQRGLILSKASDAVGRKVDVQDIHASLGRGVIADLRGVTIADDPRFSQTPFVQAADVYARVALMPLLSHRVEVKQISLKQPVVHIIRNQGGQLNVSSIGKKPSTGEQVTPAPATPPPAAGTAPLKGAPLTEAQPSGQPSASAGALGSVSVSSLTVEDADDCLPGCGRGAGHGERGQPGCREPRRQHAGRHQAEPGCAGYKQEPLADRQGRAVDNQRRDRYDRSTGGIRVGRRAGYDGPLKAVPQIAKALPPQLQLTNPVTASIKVDGNPRRSRLTSRPT